MMRKCHLNTCPVGIATQDPILRERFRGAPEHVVNYFFFVAEEVRALMAMLGARSFAELVGRTELLSARALESHPKARTLDLGAILTVPELAKNVTRGSHKLAGRGSRPRKLALSKLEELATGSLEEATPSRFSMRLENKDRAFGADLAGAVARKHGPNGLDDDTIMIDAKGTAGQSFGAFAARGMTLALEGSANDYVGKGLSGGILVVRPPAAQRALAHTHAIVGNTVLYGATSGRAFFAGTAGERFAVRNSGSIAVVEGVGDHGCEYMTGGVVVVLGPVGRNFAAGLSGGIVYVLDLPEEAALGEPDLLQEPLAAEDEVAVAGLLREHAKRALSVRAAELVREWSASRLRFRKIWSPEFKAIKLRDSEALHG
jgi:glutamate synthase (NADPH/NADH) large chain